MPASLVFPPKPDAIRAIFGRTRAVIGVIHSRPLPGAPAYDGEPMEDVIGFALAEAERYRDGGVDGLIVENHGDIPFAKPEALGPETAACMAVMTRAVRLTSGLPVGVNVLANAAVPIVSVIGIGVALLIGGVVVTESVFNLPGLGRLTVDAVLARDFPVIQAMILLTSGIYVAVNLLIDLAYSLLDPRIRY